MLYLDKVVLSNNRLSKMFPFYDWMYQSQSKKKRTNKEYRTVGFRWSCIDPPLIVLTANVHNQMQIVAKETSS